MTTKRLFAPLLVAAALPLGGCVIAAGDTYVESASPRAESAPVEAPAKARAKNVILFIGDGMGISTITAAPSLFACARPRASTSRPPPGAGA